MPSSRWTPASGGDKWRHKRRPVAAISCPCQQRTLASGGDNRMRPSPPRPPPWRSSSSPACRIDKTKIIFIGGRDEGRSPSKQGRPASGGDKWMRGRSKSPSRRSSSSSSSFCDQTCRTCETDETKMPPSGCHLGDRGRSPSQHRSEQGRPASGGDKRMRQSPSLSPSHSACEIDKTEIIPNEGHEGDEGRSPSKPASDGDKRR